MSHFPRPWKEGRLILLSKASNSASSQLARYRPITLLNTLAKVFERCIQARLQWLADRHGWLSDNQFGFVHGKSAEKALAKITQFIDERQSHWRKTLAISLDISKAFDTVWRPAIIQGFLLIIPLIKESLLVAYADDFTLLTLVRGRLPTKAIHTFLIIMALWSTENGLELNPRKTQACFFQWRRVRPNPDPGLITLGQPIPISKTITILGCRAIVPRLTNSIHRKFGISYAVGIKIHRSVVIPALLHGVSDWSRHASSKEGARQLWSIHYTFAKHILRGGPCTPTIPGIFLTGSASLDIIIQARLAFLKEIKEGNYEWKQGFAALPYPPFRRPLSFSLNVEEQKLQTYIIDIKHFKIFENIIKNKINKYYEENNLMSPRQHGFTKHKSTNSAMEDIIETILKHRQGELTSLITVDIAGAFDNAWWPAIIRRLDLDNIPSKLIRIIQSYLNSERRPNFSYEDTNVTKNLTKGCPQGGPISPILWNILLNDLLKSFKHPNAEIICYADDVSIICWSKSVEDLKILSEYILCYVMQWCNRNKLSISPEKTNLLYLHNKSKVPIELSNIILNPVDQVKILGIKFSNHRIKKKINFTPHINDILCRIVRMKNFLFSLCGKMWGLTTKKRTILYKTIIRPVLTYGSEIWYRFINSRCKEKLNSTQYQILLWVSRAYKTTSSNCVHSLANIPLLTDYIESKIIKYDLAHLSIEDQNTYKPHSPSIIGSFLSAKIDELFLKTNETFQSFFPFGIPTYFRSNFYNTQFITNHGNFNGFLSKIGAIEDSSCHCGNEFQDSRHLLLECPLFFTARQQTINNVVDLYQFINWTKPFTKTGIDFAGPVIVKTSKLRNARCDKAYIALFICMFSKAIHIELVTNLTTEAFLDAFRRFIARRGRPAEINTDDATNFVGAYKDLRKLFNSNIHDFASSEEIKWNFIPPYSPHFGGLWEAGIKSVKYHLRRIVGKTKLTFEELTTVLTQIEACLNPRPLCLLTDDPEDLTAFHP
ncbi:hypothetical protein LAZ67_3002072 [Cordylochernes scorpioides]|uniref:Reverse transcriptase domain-containing protein n=1 Tax=Cordylochernes scorpioides TaxID=51811 RepID=A0ABY6K7P3_9ARAC|nr:hypothetical protein LAZ67_3002072 [Cordylochernes scorpioides]